MKTFEEVFAKELNTIATTTFREFLLYCYSKAPDYILSEWSSTTGKYHPSDEINDNGMIIHIKRCVAYAKEIAIKDQCDIKQKDVLIAGCLFHDLLKMGMTVDPTKKNYTNERHPVFAYRFLEECWKTYDKKDDILSSMVDNLKLVCLYHEGQWTNYKGTWLQEDVELLDIEKTKEQKKLCKLMHDVDFFASRRSIYDIMQNTEGDYAKI